MNPLDFSDPPATGRRKPIAYPPPYRKWHVSAPPSRLLYVILALFFGLIGLHNFYAGRYVTGACQLLTFCVGVSLLVIVVGVFPLAALFLWVIADIVLVRRAGSGEHMT